MSLSVLYLGAQSVGASEFSMARGTTYAIPVTVTDDALAIAIEAHVGDGNSLMGAALYEDDAGQPGNIIAIAQRPGSDQKYSTTERWITFALGRWVTAGDYWIGVSDTHATPNLELDYDTGSSGDGYTIAAAGATGYMLEPGATGATSTATDRTYSIRLVLLSESSPRQMQVSFAEMEVGTAPRRAQVSFAEMEFGVPPRRAQMSWAEMEVPSLPRQLQLSWAELEIDTAPRRLQVSWACMETYVAQRLPRHHQLRLEGDHLGSPTWLYIVNVKLLQGHSNTVAVSTIFQSLAETEEHPFIWAAVEQVWTDRATYATVALLKDAMNAGLTAAGYTRPDGGPL